MAVEISKGRIDNSDDSMKKGEFGKFTGNEGHNFSSNMPCSKKVKCKGSSSLAF